jgi:NAD-dependent dihydropyrimidine dehydrogenase PreA subunit
MALMIIDTCTACDACEPVCPNKAIKCKLVCPADCIVAHPDWIESQDDLLAKYQQLHA